jgi:hypothetical protein
VNFASSEIKKEVTCKKCKKSFPSNNQLHKHVREDNYKRPGILKSKNQATVESDTEETTEKSSVVTPVSLALTAIPVVESAVDSKSDIGTGFGFRNWHFVTVMFKFSVKGATHKVCMDTGCSVTLIDRKWLLTNRPDILLRIMSKPLLIRGIGGKV